MGITNRERTTLLSTNNIPNKHRDQFFPEDYIKDMDYLDGKLGDLSEEIFESVPCIKSGTGVLTRTDNDTIDVTALYAWTYEGTIVRPIYRVGSSFDPDISAGDGIYFVKLIYSESETGTTRQKTYDASTYSPFTQDSSSYVIDQTAPTSTELCIGAFTVSGGNIVSVNLGVGSNKSPDAKFNTSNIKVADGSIDTAQLAPGVLSGSAGQITTKYRGAFTSAYLVSGDANRKGELFYNGIATSTVLGVANDPEDQEQEFPLSRVDNSQTTVNGSGQSVPTSLTESFRMTFTPSSDLALPSGENPALRQQRFGVYFNTVGSGYTQLTVALHDVNDILLTSTNVSFSGSEIVTGWNYFDLVYTLSAGQTYHVHVFTDTISAGASPVIADDPSTNLAFRQMYKPLAGKYGGTNSPDVFSVLDYQGNIVSSTNSSTADNIVTPGDGFAGEAGQTAQYQIMGVDFSNSIYWNSFTYENYWAVDLATGRIKAPPGLDVRDYFYEFNVTENVGDIDAKNILMHEADSSQVISVHDFVINTGRTLYTLADAATTIIGTAGGKYELMVVGEELKQADIWFDGTNANVVTFSNDISNSQSNAGTANIYVSGGNLTLENLLGASKEFAVFKKVTA